MATSEPILDALTMLYTRFTHSMARIARLVGMYKKLAVDEDATDVLRSAIVLTHATIEDMMRNVLTLRMQFAPPESWESFKLDGKTLVALAKANRGVTDLLLAALEAKLQYMTFNNKQDIKDALKKVQISVDRSWEDELDEVEVLMKRRHQIVHRGDFLDRAVDVTPIDVADVEKALDALLSFFINIKRVIKELAEKDRPPLAIPTTMANQSLKV